MKSKYWYYKSSDIIGTGKEEQEVRALRIKKRAAKALKAQQKL
jgi:hypothetical protein